jgi:hypothetical protein
MGGNGTILALLSDLSRSSESSSYKGSEPDTIRACGSPSAAAVAGAPCTVHEGTELGPLIGADDNAVPQFALDPGLPMGGEHLRHRSLPHRNRNVDRLPRRDPPESDTGQPHLRHRRQPPRTTFILHTTYYARRAFDGSLPRCYVPRRIERAGTCARDRSPNDVGFDQRRPVMGAGPLPQSGRLDLNQRPFGPQPNALPDCATPRSPFRVSGPPAGGYRKRSGRRGSNPY